MSRRRKTSRGDRPGEPDLFLNRELSWLEFNHRVLEEAGDPTVPLLERLKFAVIVATNLDEFFMVRVAGLRHEIDQGESSPDASGLTPAQQLQKVSERAHVLVDDLYAVLLGEILPGLAARGVRILGLAELPDAQRAAVARVFRDEIAPALTPLAIDWSRPFPMLANLSLNLGILVAPEASEGGPRLAVVQVPAGLPRLLRIPGGDPGTYVWIEEVIRAHLASLFPGPPVLDTALFRITRDSELEMDDEGGRDYLQEIEAELKKRQRARVVRFEVEAAVGAELLDALSRRVSIDAPEVYRIRGPIDLRPLLTLLDQPFLEDLRDPPLRPLPAVETGLTGGIFGVLDQRDVLLHHPYDAFDPVVVFAREAADDPDVLAIKQTLYRTSGDSPVVLALMRAAGAGKQVTVVVELMARFDERSNIGWARLLEEAGAHVLYGVRSYKVHAKICLVVRRTPQGIRRYVHLGTGNYNDKTARLYTDFGLLTADPRIGEDASGFFNALTGYSDPPRMRTLRMAPFDLRERFLELIGRERRRAESGQAAEIRAKMNSLVDREIIRALYDASAAGVRVRLNVRGICCLRPGLKGVSDRIEVVSVVDRFLEHARIFYFRNGGDDELYLSSADWMPRNLDRRIELLFPVQSSDERQKVLAALDAMFLDTLKGRWLQPDGTYRRQRPAKGEPGYRAQIELYDETRRAYARARAARDATLEPITGHDAT
jgi:polyphosphate kinase